MENVIQALEKSSTNYLAMQIIINIIFDDEKWIQFAIKNGILYKISAFLTRNEFSVIVNTLSVLEILFKLMGRFDVTVPPVL